MRCYLVLAACAAFVSTTTAAPIQISTLANTSTAVGNFTDSPSTVIVMQAGQSDPAKRVGITIPNIEPDPRERILSYAPDDGMNRFWTITQANANDFGLDWDAFETELNHPDSRFYFVLVRPDQTTNLGGSVRNIAGYPLADFKLDRIEINLQYWFWHPVLSALRAARIEGKIIGDGRLVPEPNALVFVAMALAASGFRRQRHARKLAGRLSQCCDIATKRGGRTQV